MFLISAPSFAISLVLAVFYLANLVFFAANRQQDKGNAVETVHVSRANQCTQHAVDLHGRNNAPKHTASSSIRIGNTGFARFFAVIARDTSPLPCISPTVFDAGFCWKLFSRPPPAC